jgi:AcrR family transcriptional regulator
MDSVTDSLSPEKRQQILLGAASVFAADGYEGASMTRIAAEAGVSKGTLYNYFTSKAALFSAHVAETCERRLTHVFDGARHEETPAAALTEIGRRMLTMMISDAGLMMYRMAIAEAAKFPDLARAFFEAGPQKAIGFLADWLTEEARLGRLCVPDPRFAAEQFFNLCQTHLVLRRRLAMLETPTTAEIDKVVGAAVWVFLRGYGVEGGGLHACARNSRRDQ